MPVGDLRTILLNGAPEAESSPTSPPSHDIPDLGAYANLSTALNAVVGSCPAAPAFVTARGCVTYKRLRAMAAATARAILAQPGFNPGDRVAIIVETGPVYPVALYAVMMAGAVAVPIPPDASAGRIEHVLSQCDISIVVSTPRSVASLAERSTRSRAECDLAIIDPEDVGPAPAQSRANIALILFTSGSTGAPKGVCLTHGNILANTTYIWNHLPIVCDDRVLCTAPLYHAFGHGVMQSHLLAGAAVIIDGTPAFPATIAAAARAHAATCIAAVPEVYRFMLKSNALARDRITTLRYVTTAGAPMPPEDAQAIADLIAPAPIFICYGQTESTSRLCVLSSQDLPQRAGSVGRSGPDITIEVVDEHDQPVAPGVVGNLRARADNIMQQYWRDPETTARVLRSGWLYTGDRAMTDADGFIYLRGRADQIVKIGGHRINLLEVEAGATAVAGVEQAVAVAVTPEGLGPRIVLFCTVAGRNVTAESILGALRRDQPRQLVPASVEVLDSLPLTPSLKTDRPALIARAEAMFGSGTDVAATIRP